MFKSSIHLQSLIRAFLFSDFNNSISLNIIIMLLKPMNGGNETANFIVYKSYYKTSSQLRHIFVGLISGNSQSLVIYRLLVNMLI